MGIISRFTEIMEANINELLDRMEDPSKMIDQSLRDLNEELAEVKKETAAIMAQEAANKRHVDELQAEIEKYDSAARKALTAGNEDDARVLLARKQELQSQKATADNTYIIAKANADKMRQMYDKLVSDINTLNSRRQNIKSQVAMAEAQKRVNKVTASIGKSGAMDTFSRMEEKAQKMLDEAAATAELSGTGLPVDEAADLQAKYASGTDASVDEELAKLKAEMGI